MAGISTLTNSSDSLKIVSLGKLNMDCSSELAAVSGSYLISLKISLLFLSVKNCIFILLPYTSISIMLMYCTLSQFFRITRTI